MSYDVFFSYNSQDRAAVEEIACKLLERGIRCFLDLWYLPKGQPWRPLLEQTLAHTRAVAVFVGAQGMGPWQHREVDVALDYQARNNGFPVIPVLLPGCEPPLGFLKQNAWIDRRNQPVDQVVLLLEKSIRGEAPGPDLQAEFAASKSAICPYRGLFYFREEDAPFFFGRDAAINELSRAVARAPLVAVVGASGSGKSSVVRAGLVPRLRRERDAVWEIAALVPGDEPLKSLAASVVPLLFPELDSIDRREKANKLATKFAEGSINLRDIVRDVLERQTGTQRLLLVGDQWEELYTLTKDESQRRRFVDELLDATSRSALSLVLTLRGDFVGKALAYRPLSDRLQDAQVNLGPMTEEELGQAVRRPAGEVGLEFEAGLDRRILADVGDEPGNLPLLEFVLRELWETRQGGQLLHESYDRMGGLQGAVAAKAEALFERLSLPEQEATRRLFLQLVHTAEEGNDTRRRERLEDIPESSRELVRRMADERLLITAGGTESGGEAVEVAHEALIRNWKRLADWLNEDREFLLWRERLRALLEAWDHGARSEELLLRGPALAEAEGWLMRQGNALTEEQQRFIRDSIDAQRRREEEARSQHRHELENQRARAEAEEARANAERKSAETQRKYAETQRQAALKLRRLAWILAAFALLAIGAGIFAFWQQVQAQKQAIAAERAQNAAEKALTQSFTRTIGVSSADSRRRMSGQRCGNLANSTSTTIKTLERRSSRAGFRTRTTWFEALLMTRGVYTLRLDSTQP
jgi:energy-coupling factor transporter ATP-binding protein EcfA2